MTNKEAIKWLKDIHHRFNPTGEKLENEGGDVHLQALDMAIEALIEALYETEWIPVSERLPEENGAYIVTEKVFSIDDREHKGGYNTKAEQVEYYNGKWRRASFFEVIAWMPLPEPYKGETNGKM